MLGPSKVENAAAVIIFGIRHSHGQDFGQSNSCQLTLWNKEFLICPWITHSAPLPELMSVSAETVNAVRFTKYKEDTTSGSDGAHTALKQIPKYSRACD
jgi:hypothetical protein